MAEFSPLVKGSVQNKTDRLATHGGLLGSDLKLKGEMVDGRLVAPGVVLQYPCQEGLREVEARDPEHNGRTTIDPVLETIQMASISCVTEKLTHQEHIEFMHTPKGRGVCGRWGRKSV